MFENLIELMKKVKVTSSADAADAELVICGPHASFPDDIHTICSLCTAPIVHRPHAPEKAKKICISCAAIEIGNNPDAEGLITDKVAAEVVAYIAPNLPRKDEKQI